MANFFFTGHGAQGNWSDPNNWGGTLPGAADSALVMTPSSLVMNGTATLGNVMILGSSNITFNGSMTALASGSCFGFMVCDNAVATFAPGSTLNVPTGALQVGFGGQGNFVAQGTAALPTLIHTNSSTIGRSPIAGGTVTIDHATWLNDTNIFMGFQGQGTLNVINGGQVQIGRNLAVGFTHGATGTINLASGGDLSVGASAGLAGGGMNATTGSATVNVGSGSVFTVSDVLRMYTGSIINMIGGTVSIGTSGQIQENAGAKIVGNGVISVPATQGFGLYGTLEAQGGSLTVTGNVTGQGLVQIDAGSTINITGTTLAAGSISFAGAGATLELAQGAYVPAPITGFAAGDQIEMAGVTAANWNATTDVLRLTGAGGKGIDSLHLQGSYAADTFVVSQHAGLGVITFHS